MKTLLLGKGEVHPMLVGGKKEDTVVTVEHSPSLSRGCSVRWKVATVSLAVMVLLLGVAHVYQAHTVDSLTCRLDILRKDVDKLNHRLLEEGLLSELRTFQDAVSAENVLGTGEDYDYSDETDSDTDHSTDGDDDDVDDDNDDDGDDNAADDEDDNTDDHPTEKTRPKREVQGYNGGVPIIAESYGISNKTEGLRLYESLVANPQEIVYESTENPIKDHHRISSSWPSKQHRKKYHAHHGHSSKSDTRAERVPPTSPIISRPSRVMQTDKDPSRRVTNISVPQFVPQRPPKKHEGAIHVKVYQEQRAPPQSTVRALDVSENEGPRRRRRKPTRKLSSIETLEERPPVTARHRLLPAVHYDGDTSRYPMQHEHYDGNGRLRHPDGVFADWTPGKWVQQLGMERHFRLDGGVVNIMDTGLYFVYAQVHYLDEHDINGYRVYVNEEPMLQCTTMTHSVGRDRIKKSNTCFTGAALFLRENDQLSLRDIGGLRYSLFETGKSFFGLIKLGSVSVK